MKKYRHLRGTLFDIERELRSRNSGADEAISEAMVTRTKSEGSRRSALAPPDRRMSNRSVSTQGTVESDMSDMESGESDMSLTDSEFDRFIRTNRPDNKEETNATLAVELEDLGSRFAHDVRSLAIVMRAPIRQGGAHVPRGGGKGENTLFSVGSHMNQLNKTPGRWAKWPSESPRPLLYRQELLDEASFNDIKEFVRYAETQNQSIEHPWWERFKTA